MSGAEVTPLRSAQRAGRAAERQKALVEAMNTGALILAPGAPLVSAKAFVERRFTEQGQRTLVHHGGSFHAWTAGAYPQMDDAALRAEVYGFLDGARRLDDDGKITPFNPTRARVNDVLDALAAVANLPAGVRAPAWLGKPGRFKADEIISVRNGLLHLPSATLMPHTPSFYCHNAIDFDYDPLAQEPTEWFNFLGTIWDGQTHDETKLAAEKANAAEMISTLGEVFGYLLSDDTSQQKAFLLVGPKRGGKGSIARVLTRLLGAANVSGPTLASLGQNFGLAPLVNARAAIISDARLGNHENQHAIAERILAVSGEDSITIDRKYRAAWTGRLRTRFLILTNELPRLADASGALASRFIVLTMTRSFFGREDHALETKLAAELPGILNWSIAGWQRLQKRGHFVPPKGSEEAVRELDDLGSPISAFLRDACEIGAACWVNATVLFDRWVAWCKSQGRDHPGTAQTFGRDLRAAVPGIKVGQAPREQGRVRRYEGVKPK